MVEGGGHGVLRVPRGAHEFPGTRGVPISRHGSLAAHAQATQPEGRVDVGAYDEDRCALATATSNPASMAGQAVCRQTPKVGAECANCACSDLCGGGSAMGVPTEIVGGNVGFADAFVAQEAVGRLGVGPVLGDQRDALVRRPGELPSAVRAATGPGGRPGRRRRPPPG